MVGENYSKLNRLLKAWPGGTVAVLPWLAKHGVYQQLAYEYERAGWLKRVGRGAYTRLNDTVEWTGGVYALQNQLKRSVHVGGKTALEIKGLGHFVPMRGGGYLYLFGVAGERLPRWFLHYPWKLHVAHKIPRLFNEKSNDHLGLTGHSFGAFEIRVATPERAILELLSLVPQEQSADEARLLMQGLGTLRPKLVQELLKRCRSIKTKRLFLAFAEQCNHAWVKKLELKKVKLGKGKRMIVPGGILDSKYQITLPKSEVE